jgi:hypothetical protein
MQILDILHLIQSLNIILMLMYIFFDSYVHSIELIHPQVIFLSFDFIISLYSN